MCVKSIPGYGCGTSLMCMVWYVCSMQ